MLKKTFYIIATIFAVLSLLSFYTYGELYTSDYKYESQNFTVNIFNINNSYNETYLTKSVKCITTLGDGINVSYYGKDPPFPAQYKVTCMLFYVSIWKGNTTFYDNFSFSGNGNIESFCCPQGAGIYQVSTYIVILSSNASSDSSIKSMITNNTGILVAKTAEPNVLLYPGVIFGVLAVSALILSRIFGEHTLYNNRKNQGKRTVGEKVYTSFWKRK